MKKLLNEEMMNTRDIGGYETESDFKRIKYNKLIRSNVPIFLSEDSIKYLLDNNINVAIDLRNDAEVKEKVSILKKDKRFKYYHCKINGDGRIPKSKEMVSNSYLEMAEGFETIYRIFKIILNSEDNGIIYFCNAGKDRTGIVTALIMLLAGISEDDIVKDYLLSAIYLEDMLKSYTSDNKNLADIIIPKEEFIREFIDIFKSKYYSIENYMKKIGFDRTEIEKIKRNILEK